MDTLTVIARPGIRVPLEGAPRRYVEQEPVVVARSAYYLRQIKDGDLVEVPAMVVPQPSPKAGKE